MIAVQEQKHQFVLLSNINVHKTDSLKFSLPISPIMSTKSISSKHDNEVASSMDQDELQLVIAT